MTATRPPVLNVPAQIMCAPKLMVRMAEMTVVRISRERLALAVLLVGTGVLYLWNLSINGWANSFYSAAIQAGSQSWKAWFFGSSDMANSITVDKPPASLWIPALWMAVRPVREPLE